MKRLILALALAMGLALLVGPGATADNPHRVKRGQTLSGIAQSHDTSVRRLMRLNKRKIDSRGLIFPGQRLRTGGKVAKQNRRNTRPRRSVGPGRRSACGGARNQWRLPVPPRNTVVSQPFFGQYPAHSGIDLAGPLGSKVRSVARGRVVGVLHLSTSYGVHVVVQHACGIRTLYAHLRRESVFLGERVRAREIIGTRDSTGNSTGHHLHFEVMTAGGFRLDPAGYMLGVGGAENLGQDDGSALQSPIAPHPEGIGGGTPSAVLPLAFWPGPPRRKAPWSIRWDRVALCESGMNNRPRWHVNTGNGFYGGLQFTNSTWDEYRRGQFAGRADHARAKAQKIVAERVLHSWQGLGAWPNCGVRGLL